MFSNNLFTKISILLMLSLPFSSTYGQGKFIPGYIIKPNGDTVHGYIDYRNWSVNPVKISFKEQLNDTQKTYTCIDVNGFGVSHETFVSAIVQIDESKLNTDDLDETKDVLLRRDTVFLEAMVQGFKSLYYYESNGIKAQFFIKQDSVFDLLVYKKYLKNQNTSANYTENNSFLKEPADANHIVENKRFLNQLAVYLKDCPDIQKNFKNITYSKQSLEKLFSQYYKCTNAEIKFQKKTEKAIVQTGILAGVSLTSLTFTGSGFQYLVKADWDNSVNFAGGLFLNLVFPRNFNKLSFNNELFYTAYKVTGTYTYYTNENDYTIHTSAIGISYLKLNTMLRFSQPVKNTFIFLNAGVSFGLALSETNSYQREKVFYNPPVVTEFEAMAYMRKYEFAYNAGIGVRYKKYSAEIRYENGNGMSDYETLKIRSMRLYFLLGYRF
jgi:hypothetical protein